MISFVCDKCGKTVKKEDLLRLSGRWLNQSSKSHDKLTRIELCRECVILEFGVTKDG